MEPIFYLLVLYRYDIKNSLQMKAEKF